MQLMHVFGMESMLDACWAAWFLKGVADLGRGLTGALLDNRKIKAIATQREQGRGGLGGLLASGMMLLPCSAVVWDTHPASPVVLKDLLRS